MLSKTANSFSDSRLILPPAASKLNTINKATMRNKATGAWPAPCVGRLLLICSFLLAFLASFSLSGSDSKCYNRDGSERHDFFQCHDMHIDTRTSDACCEMNDLCLRSGLCFSPSHIKYYRGGCTDQSWESTDCSQICKEKNEGADRPTPIYQCRDNITWWWCEMKEHPNREEGYECFDDAGKGDQDGVYHLPTGKSCCPSEFVLRVTNHTSVGSRWGTIIWRSTESAGDPKTASTAKNKPSSVSSTSASTGSSSTATGSTPPESLRSADPVPGTQTSGPSDQITTSSLEPVATNPPESPSTAPLGATTDPTATADPNAENDGRNVPIAVGATFGTLILISASVLAFFYIRKRKREAPARAESPPGYYEPEMSIHDVHGAGLSGLRWPWKKD